MPVGKYYGLGYWTPTGYWRFQVGNDAENVGGFRQTLREQATDPELAIKQWEEFRGRLNDLCGTMSAVSLMNLRQDAGFLATTAGGAPFVMTHPWVLPDLPLVFESLHETVDKIVTEPFLRNWIDTMCIFCGFPAKGAMTAHILYILDRFFVDDACYSVPIGGTEQIANTMIRGLEKFGGKLQMNAHVAQIITENGRAVGVQLKNGKVIKAKKAVVSNATPFDTVKMLGGPENKLPAEAVEWKNTLGKLPRHGAIMHLFIAIDAKDLDLSHIKDPAHLVVQDWDKSLQDSQNLCSFFIPSLVDPSVCPEGKHCIHVYSSGGEPYEPWEKLTPGSDEYEAYKEVRPCPSRTPSPLSPFTGTLLPLCRSAPIACGKLSSAAFPTCATVSSSASSARLSRTRPSSVATAAHMAWRGLPARRPPIPACSRTSCLSRSPTSKHPSTAFCVAATLASRASAPRPLRRAASLRPTH